MDYEEGLNWLYARQNLGIKLGLEKMDKLLELMGDPQVQLRVIHVAGTNGKGSVVAMLDAVLRSAGFTVGTTTSPHLIAFNERITIGGTPARPDAIARVLPELVRAVEKLDAENNPPTFFECTTALALTVLADAGVEFAIVEAGLGGRLDATNVLLPELTIITDVGLDHQAFLGDTLAEIAWEKAGIMKPNTPLITGAQGDALTVIKGRSHDLQVPMSVLGEDYHVSPGRQFFLTTPNGQASYDLALAGKHQHHNAALVVAATDALRNGGAHIAPAALQLGLQNANHPGRLQLIAQEVQGRQIEFIVDGASNLDAGTALAEFVVELGWQKPTWIVGFCNDKPWQELMEMWQPKASKIYACQLRNPRSLVWPEEHATHASFAEALAEAVSSGASQIVVAGSLFLAGECLAHLHGLPLEEIRGTQ